MRYFISSDQNVFNASIVRQLIAENLSASYWAKDIPVSVVEKSMKNSLCFGAFVEDTNELIGFARIISDYATFAYLCDVFVVEKARGHGASKAMMTAIIAHPDLQGLRRICLITKDAHGLYEQFGFKPTDRPNGWMEIVNREIYSRAKKN